MSIHVEPRGLVEASVVHILVIGDEKVVREELAFQVVVS